MKKFLLLSFLLTAGLAPAQEKSPTAQLLDVMKYEETTVNAAVAAFDGMMDQMKQSGVPDAAIEEIRAEARQMYIRIFSSGEMRKSTEELYAKHFTEDEILELVEFYRTPLGQKTLAAMPSIMTDSMKVAMPAIQKEMAGFQEKVGKIVEKHQGADEAGE